MTETLFLMPRYLGSDESDSESQENGPGRVSGIIKKKEAKLQKSEITSPSTKSIQEETSGNRTNNDEPLLKKKKKFKEKNLPLLESCDSVDPCEENGLSQFNGKEKKRKRPVNETDLDGHTDRELEPATSDQTMPVDHATLGQSQTFNSEQQSSTKKHNSKKRKKTKHQSQVEEHGVKATSTSSDVGGAKNCMSDNQCHIQNKNESKNHDVFPVIKDMIRREHEEVKRILPEWLTNPTVIQVDIQKKGTDTAELEFLDECTKERLKEYKIQQLFPVQTEVIPWLLGSSLKRLIIRPSDLCVSAPTGSGKTLAFVIPIIQALKDRVVTSVRALVVLPVGDLAVQVFKVFQAFCKGTDLQVVLVIGQKTFSVEQLSLVRQATRGYLSRADIIVCTPGRLIDHIDSTPGFTLQNLQYLVIDEADRMMDEIQQGWLKKVENAVYEIKTAEICPCFSVKTPYRRTPPGPATACAFGRTTEPPLQKLLFSATLSQDPEKLHELSLYRPKLFTTVVNMPSAASDINDSTYQEEFIGKYTTPKTLLEYHIVCEATIKPLIICHAIKERQLKKVLCFTETVESSHSLYLILSNMLDSKVRELSSSLRAVQRKIVLEQFANGKIGILVCSDLMARGMDIEDVDCVISYDMPTFIKQYIHRIGRTARAGKDGIAITLLKEEEHVQFKKMFKSAGRAPPRKLSIENSDLVEFEDSFKSALNLTKEIILDENEKKRELSMPKSISKAVALKRGKRLNNRKFDNTKINKEIKN